MNIIPYVIEQTGNSERSFDIYSRLLVDRIIILTGEITDQTSSVVISELLFLNSQSKTKDIYIYINSPGGSVTAGLAIYDTMKYIDAPISTICVGMAMSMGAFLLAAGTKGKRFALENSEVMIHQPSGGTQGQVTDIDIQSKRLLKRKIKMNSLLAQMTGKDEETITKDCERDYFMTAMEAKEYGLIDDVLFTKDK